MAGARSLKTSFTAGEVAPELLGRPDLRAWANGARRLRNVFIQPTGGVVRRPGLRHVAALPGPAKLIAFEFNTEQTYLLALTAGEMRVFIGDAEVARVPGPWTAAMLPQLAHTQNADTLLLCHPDMAPQRITRTGHASWSVQPWAFVREPFFRFLPSAFLTPSGTTGAITLTASEPLFRAGHVATRFRLGGKRVIVTAVASPTQATATVEDAPLAAAVPTLDWDESAFSWARGWPVCLCFHQDRLVVGGSRDLPNRLWMSRTGDLFNFDLGAGLDDQAIEFGLVSDQVNAIRGVFSGGHLQVFTSGAEWMVSGTPLTPASIQLHRQTRVGAPVARMVQPVDVDGATIFASRNGRGIYEFAYTEERFDEELALDSALTGESAEAKANWRGLEHLTAQEVMVVADGAPRGAATVIAGAVALDPPARTVQVGLGFRHVVEPLPPELAGPMGVRAAPLRLVSVTFRLLETAALAVDLGRGPSPVSFRRLGTALLDAAPPRFTGDVRLRALGWSRDAMKPLWRIDDDTPLPMTLLSVTTETRITD